jgi:hypothetical protein
LCEAYATRWAIAVAKVERCEDAATSDRVAKPSGVVVRDDGDRAGRTIRGRARIGLRGGW